MMETFVWIGRGFKSEEGLLRLEGNRISLTINKHLAFDASIEELRLVWPWYGAGAQFWAHGPTQKYYVSFLHTGNTSSSWWQGIKQGRYWNRAIKAAASGLPIPP